MLCGTPLLHRKILYLIDSQADLASLGVEGLIGRVQVRSITACIAVILL